MVIQRPRIEDILSFKCVYIIYVYILSSLLIKDLFCATTFTLVQIHLNSSESIHFLYLDYYEGISLLFCFLKLTGQEILFHFLRVH